MIGVECKRVDAPKLTPSMRTALSDLGLEGVVVIYPGERRYRLAGQISSTFEPCGERGFSLRMGIERSPLYLQFESIRAGRDR
jgi:hypothetical protein